MDDQEIQLLTFSLKSISEIAISPERWYSHVSGMDVDALPPNKTRWYMGGEDVVHRVHLCGWKKTSGGILS